MPVVCKASPRDLSSLAMCKTFLTQRETDEPNEPTDEPKNQLI